MQRFLKTVGAKSKAALKTSKVKRQLSATEKEINELKYALGCKVYDDYANGVQDSKGVARSCEAIREKVAQLPLLNEKLNEIQQTKQEKLATIEAEAKARAEARAAEKAAATEAFALDSPLDNEVIEVDDAAITEIAAEDNVCPKCGEINPARAKFCAQCGSRL